MYALYHWQSGLYDQIEDLGRPAVHELRPQLDRRGRSRIVNRADAAADAVKRFDARGAQPGLMQFAQRGEPGGPGADYQSIVVHR
jgi:hypothetical protein